ncbi:putative meiosis specific protein hop1 protein [Botrytis cinerea BcDW1]|uniref:Putative meiosis specific protein hop1 protein n=1 Tax=Botryotinia fuckeliana (strain BcDW1) TaxID=1290391 RepID=M7UND1_BOTF1|nr:putative meiosis specific protein hop1 protein [Botrytis cinerea BcDW1]
MPSKQLPRFDRPVRAKPPVKPQVEPQTKTKQKVKGKGKGKAKATAEAPKTVQELVLSQNQSFELVKIGVNAAVSQFVFGRKLFPSNCYKTRIYDAYDPDLTYETFINGTNIPKNFNLNEAGDEIVSFNSVVRGTGNPGAEKLLDWLEFGVADAVSDKCLAKFQLSVYRKEVVPEQLVEAFTINFTYKDVEKNPYVQISASLSNDNGVTINLGLAQEGLRDLIRQVMNSSRNVQGQSAGRKVSMKLLYNENTRPKHEYRGFRAASSSQILPDGCGILMGQTSNGIHGLEIKYYDAPVIDTHFSKATALSDAKVTSSRKHFATVTRLKSTTPLANMVIDDNSQSSLRHSQLSQSVDTHQSTVQWINQIGHAKGSDDTDTQPIPAYQSTTFGGHAASVGPEELSNTVIEEASEAVEEEVECECQNHDDRENLNSFNDMEGLCQYMNRNLKDTQALFRSLETEGFIKKCSKSSKEPFRFCDRKKLQTELFDPSKHISHTKPVGNPSSQPMKRSNPPQFATAAPKTDLTGKSLDQTQLTPVGRRLRRPEGSIRSGLRSEGSSTQTPSSWRSLNNETSGRSPRVPAQTTPQQPNKRAGDEVSDSARKRMRSALVATSPFSLRSNSSQWPVTKSRTER